MVVPKLFVINSTYVTNTETAVHFNCEPHSHTNPITSTILCSEMNSRRPHAVLQLCEAIRDIRAILATVYMKNAYETPHTCIQYTLVYTFSNILSRGDLRVVNWRVRSEGFNIFHQIPVEREHTTYPINELCMYL